MSFPRQAPQPGRPFLAFPASGYVFSQACSPAGQTFSRFSRLRVCLFPGKLPSRADLFSLFKPQGMSFPWQASPSGRPFLAFPAPGYVFPPASFPAGQTFSCFSSSKVCLFPGKLPRRADLFSLFKPQGMSFPRHALQPGRPFLAFQASGYVFSQACSPAGQTFSCFSRLGVCPSTHKAPSRTPCGRQQRSYACLIIQSPQSSCKVIVHSDMKRSLKC